MPMRHKLCANFKGTISSSKFNHPAHQIDIINCFGDTVFNLQTRIDFEEIESVARCVVYKFDRTGRTVRNPLHKSQSRFMQRFASLFGQARRRRFFNDLLVTALHRAIAFAQNNSIAIAIAKDLYFDMTATFYILFDKEARILEVVFTQSLDAVKAFNEFLFAVANAHANTTTACGTLEHYRIADFLGMCNSIFQAFQKT